MSSYKARVKQVKEVADEVLEIEMELLEPNVIEFRAGQFLMLTVPDEEGKIVKRAYSIASMPSEDGKVTFVIKLRPDGKASDYVRTFKGGEEVTLDGPLGHFYLDSGHEKDMVFVATGTGIAPVRSMILQNIAEGNSNQMHLYFGVRSEKDVFWCDEFEGLATQHSNFHCNVTLSQPGEEWEGAKGRVTDHLHELDIDPDNVQIYLCGSMAMVNEVTEILEGKGVAKEDIKKEIY